MSIKIHPSLVKSYYSLFSRDVVRFVVVGGFGFIVNYVVLTILISGLGLPTLAAQIISTEIALLATFIGNNYWAFKGHEHIPVFHKLVKFHMSAGIGLVINVSAQALLVSYGHIHYGIALVGGTLAGLVWNYTLNKKFVFKKLDDNDSLVTKS